MLHLSIYKSTSFLADVSNDVLGIFFVPLPQFCDDTYVATHTLVVFTFLMLLSLWITISITTAFFCPLPTTPLASLSVCIWMDTGGEYRKMLNLNLSPILSTVVSAHFASINSMSAATYTLLLCVMIIFEKPASELLPGAVDSVGVDYA